jgi:Dolichyl-phosphate-mannose-protein mannosyltransferase
VSTSAAPLDLRLRARAATSVGPTPAWAAHWPLAVLLVAVAANWLLWASAVPFGDAPDEPSHLDVAQFVASHGRLPTFGPGADMYVWLDQVGIPIEPHALAPPLTYLLDGALIRLLPVAAPVAARVGSLLAALAAVALTYAFVRTVLPTRRTWALATAAVLAAVPQFSFQAAAANSDVFALATVLAVACLWRRVTRPLGALAFGLALGGAILSKYTAYPAAAAALLAAGWQACTAATLNRHAVARCPGGRAAAPGGPALAGGNEPGGRGGARNTASATAPALRGGGPLRLLAVGEPLASSVGWGRAVGLVALVGLGTALVAEPWLLHNWRLYGRPLPLGVADAAIRALTPAVDVPGAPAARALWDVEYLRSWAVITFRSFWAGFDRVSLFAPGWVYAALVLALAGAAAGAVRGLTAPSARARVAAVLWSPAGLLLLMWPAATLLATIQQSLGRYYPVHGRYLLVLLPLVALGLVVGWSAVVPVRWAPLAPWAIVAGMAALNAYCLLGVVVPHYYGPSGTRVTVTVDSPLPSAVTADLVPIRGWAVVTGRPGWQPGIVGGAPAWYLPAASVWVTVDGERPPGLSGGAHVERPDVARTLGAPGAASAGFAYQWDARAAAPGTHLVQVCAADPAAQAPTCVPLPVLVGVESGSQSRSPGPAAVQATGWE